MTRHVLARVAALVFAALLLGPSTGRASQGSVCMPTTGTVTGLAFSQSQNAAFAALLSSNSGNSAPANDCTGAPVTGQIWLDTSTNPRVWRMFDGSQWVAIGTLDASNHLWLPDLGGGTATLASATTVDLGAAPQSTLTISGTATITGFGSSAKAGILKVLRFTGAATIAHNATSLIVPGGVNVTTAAGDQAVVAHLGNGNWSVAAYTKASGQALQNPSVPVGAVIPYAGFTAPADFAFAAGQCFDRASEPALTAALSLSQNVTRTSGSSTLTSVPDTSQLGAGMPIEGSGIPGGALIVSVTASTIVMSANATTSGTAAGTVFPYGTCGDSSKVAVPDLRGRAIAGRDDMGGTAAGRLTSAGASLNGVQLGAAGGSQTHTLTLAQIPAHDHGGTTGTQTYSDRYTPVSLVTVGVGSPQVNYYIPSNDLDVSRTQAGHSIPSAGGGGAHPIVQPTMVSNYIIRVR